MTEPIRVGLIGCGNNMATHVKRLLPNPDARVVGMADPVPAGIARLRERYPTLVDVADFSSYQDMLQTARPDAVIISTPHSLHYEQIMAALESGCHVLCEKPLVLQVAHAQDVIKLSEQSGRQLLVSYQRHYAPVFRYMRQLIGDGKIGSVRFVQALQNQNWYQTQKAANRWRIVPEVSGGGQLNDSGSHLIDILLHVTGLTVDSVFCRQERLDLSVDVNSALTLGFTNGALGSLAIVGDAPGIGGQVWEDITIYGSEGAIYYRMMGGILDRAPLIELRAQIGDQSLPIGELPPASDPDSAFIDVILGRAENEAPASCGLRVAELTEAAWHSARQGQPVRVADVVQSGLVRA